ncbi:MAG: hypothetical protein EXR72_04845 [Myxococcales bacterium]|nr:hypothetical protein [Myxococcales bacterium]
MTKRKKWGILSAVGLFALLFAWQGGRAWWNHGYSRGTRTGVIRKISVKGSPLCKYLEGEMVLIGSQAGVAEIWTFTVDNDAPEMPVVKALHEGEKAAKQITLAYRQDKGKWWACAPTEYYVTGVE